MVDIEPLDAGDVELVRTLVVRHVEATDSGLGARLLGAWASVECQFLKIMPRDYKRVRLAEARARAEQREPEFAELVG
jgi:glutamate synthase (NADPH/NADH) large chain